MIGEKAYIEYDPSQTDIETMKQAVEKVGYGLEEIQETKKTEVKMPQHPLLEDLETQISLMLRIINSAIREQSMLTSLKIS